MAVKKRRWIKKTVGGLFVFALVLVLIGWGADVVQGTELIENAAVFSAMLTIPEGGQYAARQVTFGGGILHAQNDSPTSSAPPQGAPEQSAETPEEAEAADSSQPAVSSMPATPPEGVETGPVSTQFLDPSVANLKWENIYISNKTSEHTVDIAEEIQNNPSISIKKDGTPQVLIFHTHATEKYLGGDVGYYIQGESTHTDDNTQNVVRVGEEIKKQLEAAGIVTLHDETQHDNPSYNGSYERSAETIKKYLAEYPSIQVVLDIHRDAITRDDGTKLKPTVEIDGKKAAQIMICAGCQDGEVSGFEGWMQNMRFALRIQQACETDYPGLNRSIYFVGKKYNEYLSPGSLLFEMGSEANTLEEAIYSGELLGKSLVKVLNELVVES